MLRISPALWNETKGRCTGKDVGSQEINRYLDSVRHRLYDIHRTMEEGDKLINPSELKRKFLGVDEKHRTLFEVFQRNGLKIISSKRSSDERS